MAEHEKHEKHEKPDPDERERGRSEPTGSGDRVSPGAGPVDDAAPETAVDPRLAANPPGAAWGLGVAVGVSVGVSLGVALDNIGIGLALGAGIAVAFGASFSAADAAARRKKTGGDPPAG